MSPMAQEILAMVTNKGNVSFAELERIDGFGGGPWSIGVPDHNLIMWRGLTREAFDALEELRELIHPKPASFLVYMCDGKVPCLPVAKSARRYKKPHWAPVVYNLSKSLRKAATT